MQIPETEIIVTKDGAEILRKTVRPGDYVIGRESGCEVQLDVELVSRRHAQLTVNFDHALIEDLGSSNGTFVNGQPVTEPTRLWPNQKIQIGAAIVKIHRIKTASAPDASLAPQTAAMQRLLPEEFLREKKYDIGKIVAHGGMGAILDVRDAATQRRVAMKVMLDGSNPDDLSRFVAEARVTSQLEHPSIVPVHELGIDENGQPFYTMKMVRGITLRKVLELLAEGVPETVKKYSLPALLTIFQKVCDALAFAHSRGVIHRDLKPENVMLDDFGVVLVMDWGLAKVLARSQKPDASAQNITRSFVATARTAHGDTNRTMSGSIMGTPQYMAPEQARGEVESMDQRADIYALGAILFHLLFLRPSVTGTDAWEIVGKVERGEIAWPVSKELRAAPESLAAVVRKAMALDPVQRYGSVADLQADVTAFQNGFATSAEKAGWFKRAALAIKRNKTASIASVIVLVSVFGFGTNAVVEGHRAKRALADLRGTAPTFHAQAVALLNDGKFDEAIEKIGFAIKLDDANADYHLFRANLWQAMQRITGAAGEYRHVLAVRPGDNAAIKNLALCEHLLAERGGAESLSREQQKRLLGALREQKRLVEAGPLNALLDPDMAIAEAALRARLREYQKQTGWKNDRVARLSDGTFKVELGTLALGDLSVLHGQPISVLSLRATGVADLSPLIGLPLKELNIPSSKVADLSPLRGMPLEHFDAGSTLVSDLSPLAGMKLRFLSVNDTNVSDLTPLTGMPLESLSIQGTRVVDLTPLRGMPLTNFAAVNCRFLSDITPLAMCSKLQRLQLTNSGVHDFTPLTKLHLTELRCDGTGVTDLAPLRGQPLRRFDIGNNRHQGIDLNPLAECPTLEEIVLPEQAKNVDALRKLPHLKRISTRASQGLPLQTAGEFWKEYDAKQAAGK